MTPKRFLQLEERIVRWEGVGVHVMNRLIQVYPDCRNLSGQFDLNDLLETWPKPGALRHAAHGLRD